jgi:phospholipase/carboxylesterase
MGFSQGGILSYSMALTYPELFNKIAILSAYPETKILQNISKDKKHLQKCVYFPRNGRCCNSFGYGKSGGRYVV